MRTGPFGPVLFRRSGCAISVAARRENWPSELILVVDALLGVLMDVTASGILSLLSLLESRQAGDQVLDALCFD